MENNTLEAVKSQQWFYEFRLPDGSITQSYLPDFVRPIHHTREKALRKFLKDFSSSGIFDKAIDVSCHEGYYSHLLAGFFKHVRAIDKNEGSLAKAKLITEALNVNNIEYILTSLEEWKDAEPADLVLCYGLLYHIENPVEIMRKLTAITKKAICIESQILPSSSKMLIEDGCYIKQRESKGTFGLCMDYPTIKEGGLTELALVPSADALVSLLEYFGFGNIRFYEPEEVDYEQFTRGHRVIIYAEKTNL
jgi:hypothetical protein